MCQCCRARERTWRIAIEGFRPAPNAHLREQHNYSTLAAWRFYELADERRPAAKRKLCQLLVSRGGSNTASHKANDLLVCSSRRLAVAALAASCFTDLSLFCFGGLQKLKSLAFFFLLSKECSVKLIF